MPFTNPQAQIGIYNSDPTTILAGCGVVLSGGNVSGLLNCKHVTADSWIYGVMDLDCLASSGGIIYHCNYSDVQVRLASNVTRGDRLNIANSIGEFQLAPSTAANIMYIALENGVTGGLCWSSPCGSAANTALPPVIQTAEGRVTTNITTGSGTLVDMTGASVTITTSAGTKVLVVSSYSTSTASLLGATTTLVLDIDGSTELGSASSFTLLANSTQGGGFTRLKTGLIAGSHTFKLKWLTSASTAQCRPVSNPGSEHAVITVMEVRV